MHIGSIRDPCCFGDSLMGDQNRTEPPSKRKLRKAREKGEVAFSRELAGASALVGAWLALIVSGNSFARELSDFARRCFSGGEVFEWVGALSILLRFAGIVGGSAAAAGLIASVAQVGFGFRLRLDPSRLNLVKGIARLFRKERLVDLGLLVGRVAVLGIVGIWQAVPMLADVLERSDCGLVDLAAAGGVILVRTAGCLAAVALGLGVLDWVVQRRRHMGRLRMTREELLREHKEQEGDPHLRAERRRRHRVLLSGLGSLRRASVVVVNPTRIAVALCYRAVEDDAPWVVASGFEELARRIRDEAARQGIPVVEHVPLAKALVILEPGDEIPATLYLAAAEVIRAVQENEPIGDRSPTKNRLL